MVFKYITLGVVPILRFGNKLFCSDISLPSFLFATMPTQTMPKVLLISPNDDSQDHPLPLRVTSRRRPTPYYPAEALKELWESVERIEESLQRGRHLEKSGDLEGTEASNSPTTSLSKLDGPSPEVALHRTLALEKLCSAEPVQTDLSEHGAASGTRSDLRLETLSPRGKISSDLAARRAGRIFHLVPNCPSNEGDHETHPAAESLEPLVRFSFSPTSEDASIYTGNSNRSGSPGRLYKDGYRSNTSDENLEIYSMYGSSADRRSFISHSSENVDYQPGPISHENQRFDPALQRSLEDYQINYSRRVYEEPISPKGHPLPGPWIYPPPLFKKFEACLGSRYKFSFGVQRLPGPNTSRVRHCFYKTRKALRHHLSVIVPLLNRLIRRITSLYKRRQTRPKSPLLRFTPIPTPFNPELPLPRIPELQKHLYNMPERAIIPEELPGFLELSDSALFHHNLLVDMIRFGERPRNLVDYIEWSDFRAEGRKTAASLPEGYDFSTTAEGGKGDGMSRQRTDTGDIGSIF